MKSTMVAVTLLIALALPSITIGQATAGASREWSSVIAAQLGDEFLVQMKNGRSVHGTLSRVSPAGLTLLGNNASTADVKQSDVSKIYRMTETRGRNPVLVGTAVGAGIGFVVGIAAGGGMKFCCERSITVPIGAASGAGLGALGGFIAGMFHKRTLIYESQ